MKCPCCDGTGEIPESPEAKIRILPRAQALIAHYYRSRAAGNRRMTLKRLAKASGYSYGYLRTVKVDYDRAGKWGSKKKSLTT